MWGAEQLARVQPPRIEMRGGWPRATKSHGASGKMSSTTRAIERLSRQVKAAHRLCTASSKVVARVKSVEFTELVMMSLAEGPRSQPFAVAACFASKGLERPCPPARGRWRRSNEGGVAESLSVSMG